MTELYNFIEIIFSGLDLKTNCIYYRIDFGSDNDNISKRIVRKSEKKLKKLKEIHKKSVKTTPLIGRNDISDNKKLIWKLLE